MAEIDTLQVKITANAKSATDALVSLAGALKKVKQQLTGMKDGVSVSDRLSKSLNEMNGALNTITTSSIKKIQKLANALNEYSVAVKNIKSAGSIASSITSAERALTAVNKRKAAWKSSVTESDYTEEDFKILNESDVSSGDTASVTSKIKLFDRLKDSLKGLKERLNGIKESFKGFMKNLKISDTFLGKFLKSIGRIAFYRAIRAAIKAIGQAFEEGLKNAYAYSKQSDDFTRLADTLDRIKSITYQMINQLGALWGEIKQFFLPAIEWLVEKVRYLAEKATEFMAALNGESTYLRANYVEKSWDDATEAVKKYKHQLLGLDELNVLSDQQSAKKGKDEDHSKDFEVVEVSDKIKQIGLRWKQLKEELQNSLSDWHNVLMIGIGAAVLGTILLLGTRFKALGLGLIIAGGYFAGKEIAMHWGEMKAEIEQAMNDYWGLFAVGAIGLTVVGAALLFTRHFPLGLGCILAGVSLGVATVAMAWETMYNDIYSAMNKYRGLFALGAIGLTVVGAALLFTGHIGLGLGCILGGISLGVTVISMAWEGIYKDIEAAFQKFAPLFAIAGLGSLAVGILLLFTGHIGLGLGLLLAGGFLLAETISFNWDSILDGIKGAWESVKSWWNGTVMGAVKRGVEKVEELLGIDFNKDGVVGAVITTHVANSGAIHGGASGGFALGGVPTQGSLFYAGESGAEFVGNIGTTSAVANTGQMTDAIYKAAYMGMSKALKENGGGGMNGFEPASTEDLFIAMRKKASNYNRTTGNSAFA